MCSEACHLQQTCTPFTSDHSTHRPTRRPNNFNTLSLHSVNCCVLYKQFLLVRRYASAVLAVRVSRPSVCPVVCHTPVNVGSRMTRKQRFVPRDSSILTPTVVGGQHRIHPKFALKVTHPLLNTTISTNIRSYCLNRESWRKMFK